MDANYDADIESSRAFSSVLDYHRDSVSFWQREGVHHPFLLSTYPRSGKGRRYHANFARLGFVAQHARLVSFVELLHVPTVGKNPLTVADFDPVHLDRVNAAIINGNAEHIFISDKVSRLMRQTGHFP